MVEAAAGEDGGVEVGRGDADRHAGSLGADHPAGGGAVPVKLVAFAPEAGGRAIRLAVDRVGDVGDHGGIKDVVDSGAVEAAPIWGPPHPVTLCDREVVVGHNLPLAVIDLTVIA